MRTSTHPIKYKNSIGTTMPAFGIFKLEGGTRVSGELLPHAELPLANGNEALYVNGAKTNEDGGYGNAQSCNNGPFWVRYNPSNAPSDGDVVGPVASQTYVDGTGDGLVVIYKDTAKGIALCEKLGGGGTPVVPVLGGGGPFTIAEYDATTGDIINTMYRGKRRASSATALSDYHVRQLSDGMLVACGDGATAYNRDSGIVVKWNPDSLEKLWDSDRSGLTSVVPGSPTGAISDDAFGPSLIEADDGGIWVRDGANLNRFNSSGVQTSNTIVGTNGEVILPTGENGAIIAFNDTTAYGTTGKSIIRYNSSGTETHSVNYPSGSSASRSSFPQVAGGYLVHGLTGLTSVIVRNVTDLTSVTSHTPGGSIYGCATDGTQVFMAKTNYEARSITDLATTLWTGGANPIATSATYMLYQRSKLYHFATSTARVVRINPADGTVIFNVTSGIVGLQTANLAAVGSDFLMIGQTAASGQNILCLEESDGSVRWGDYWLSVRCVIVSDDDRIWVCGLRSDQ